MWCATVVEHVELSSEVVLHHVLTQPPEVASGLLILFVHWSWTRHSWFPTCCEEVLSQYVQHNYVQESRSENFSCPHSTRGCWPLAKIWSVRLNCGCAYWCFCTFKTDQTLLFKRNLELPPPGKNSEAWMASGKMLGLPPDRWTTRPGPVHILRWLHNPMTIDLVTRDKQLNLNWFDDAFDQSISDWSFQNLLLFSRERIHDDVSQWLQLHWCKIQVGTLRKWQNPWFRRYFCVRQLFFLMSQGEALDWQRYQGRKTGPCSSLRCHKNLLAD